MTKSTNMRDYQPSVHALEKIKELHVIHTEFDITNLHVATIGWIGKRQFIKGSHSKLITALAAGYRLIEWNSLYVITLSLCKNN